MAGERPLSSVEEEMVGAGIMAIPTLALGVLAFGLRDDWWPQAITWAGVWRGALLGLVAVIVLSAIMFWSVKGRA
jgi:hypothetical protein